MQPKYDWKIPNYTDLVNEHYCWEYSYTIDGSDYIDSADGSGSVSSINVNCVRLMFRIRYNISTMDYDPYLTDSSQDYDGDEGILSPVEQDPTVDVGIYAQVESLIPFCVLLCLFLFVFL